MPVESADPRDAAPRVPPMPAARTHAPGRLGSSADLLCFSHLRWDDVFQRPQHLMVRWARERRVFYLEEPRITEGPPRYQIEKARDGLHVVTPWLPPGMDQPAWLQAEAALLDQLLRHEAIRAFVAWYYTPMAVGFTRHLRPLLTVYDCMDELAAFAAAPPPMRERERDLLARADVVFTGGHSLFEAKRRLHPFVHAFPSSVDVAHFARARDPLEDPADQAAIPRPRIGYYGVIDERMDCALIAGVAAARPGWQVVLVGPVAKVDVTRLPRAANIHYLGRQPYERLPAYLRGWDVAILPFVRSAVTRFISPTKTPEYLAAARPVVSTSIHDVVHPYADLGLARIADDPVAFVAAVEQALADDPASLAARADALLGRTSWDATWGAMRALVDQALERRAEGAR